MCVNSILHKMLQQMFERIRTSKQAGTIRAPHVVLPQKSTALNYELWEIRDDRKFEIFKLQIKAP
jgi:hypothetical protein